MPAASIRSDLLDDSERKAQTVRVPSNMEVTCSRPRRLFDIIQFTCEALEIGMM
jgi:hypothetical protein